MHLRMERDMVVTRIITINHKGQADEDRVKERGLYERVVTWL
ncbi:hypothetical protein HanXRQr2_Chr15g0716741 [Helianthus annuus]|uniref:Uncharacterized protein n=1 Tax=Helianthus annuus TaxID=4232 RepID=A0A9K3H402_HELAN|nr:hypothetical protein HanXRQr2_Chr15g0716741 [Helianthus annuus]KAJ0457974.1 hypothetical protein HanIR_Chr15g0779881 [Helianthus annuus]KAJ0833215.1 hypothetical protein HanPSC8_Chr15g0687721 [Helianthus annuus]